jgi:hypothetical protein
MYIPDIRRLYVECARVLRPNGLLTVGLLQPERQRMYLSNLIPDDGYDPSAGDAIEYIHYLDDIFNGLIDAGLSLERVIEEGDRDPAVPVGSLDPGYEGDYFTVVATKGLSCS